METAQVANIINACSAAGTVGALLYAFYLNNKNSKKINDLAEISRRIAEQNDLIREQLKMQKIALRGQAQPFFISKASTDGSGGKITVAVTNRGEVATITKVEFSSNEVSFREQQLPQTLRTEKSIAFEGSQKSNVHITHCEWKIHIHYSDKYYNQYILTISGFGINIFPHDTKEL